MKALKQRYHQQIVKKHKHNYFSSVRKEVLQFQQFQVLYKSILQDNQDLNVLIQKFGYVIFYKYIGQILDQKLYKKLYQNQKYFLSNLSFIGNLLAYNILPIQHIKIVISGISQIIENHSYKITTLNTRQIFQNVEKILSTQRQLQIWQCIKQQGLMLKLYKLVISKQQTDYFFKIIKFCKKLEKNNITCLNDAELVNCLQINILTSRQTQQLYASYSYLAQIFQRHYKQQQQIFQYGSIIDKTMKDIYNQRLIDPISFFFAKALQNKSLLKLLVQMNFIHIILQVIVTILLKKQSNVSIFGHQSIWKMLNQIIQIQGTQINLDQNKCTQWKQLRQKLKDSNLVKYPYIRQQIGEFLKLICQTNLKILFADLLMEYCFSANQIQI